MNNVEPIWWVVGGFVGLAVLWAICSVIAEVERDRRDRREARAHVSRIEPDDNPLGEPPEWLNDGGTSWLTLDPDSPAYKAIHEFDENRRRP